jgi:hypothetical protein
MTTRILQESGTTPLQKNGDTYKVVLITPGKGSSGYYTESMLREYGPVAFPAGSHSYVDHPKKGEGRSPEKIIGIFTEDASYEDGVGLVSYIKPFKHYKEFVEEVAPYTGMSIFCEGTGHDEEIDGEQVYLVESLTPNITNTVDLVSYAGRGGHFAESLLESALAEDEEQGKGHENMALEDEVKSLISKVDALVTEVVTAREALATAKDEVAESAPDVAKAVDATHAIESAEITEADKGRLIEGVKAGDYDVEAKITAAKEYRESVVKEVREALLAEAVEGAFDSQRSTKQHSENLEVEGW